MPRAGIPVYTTASAELATGPASSPFIVMVGSGLRVVTIMKVAAVIAPLAPARMVPTAIEAADSGPGATLKPSQPMTSRNDPSRDRGILCAGIGTKAVSRL